MYTYIHDNLFIGMYYAEYNATHYLAYYLYYVPMLFIHNTHLTIIKK